MSFLATKRHLDDLNDESELSAALPQLQESHFLDLKREPWTARANDEAEKDLSCFAFDGGFLVIGVDETTGLHPFPLKGFSERVAQIAEQLSPVLEVHVRTVPSAATPSDGYAIVEIPPSPSRLHETRARKTFMRHGTVVRAARAEDVDAIRDTGARITGLLDDLLSAALARFSTGQLGLSVAATPLSSANDLLLDRVQRSTTATSIQGFACASLMRVGHDSQLAAAQFPDGRHRSMTLFTKPLHPNIRPDDGARRISPVMLIEIPHPGRWSL